MQFKLQNNLQIWDKYLNQKPILNNNDLCFLNQIFLFFSEVKGRVNYFLW